MALTTTVQVEFAGVPPVAAILAEVLMGAVASKRMTKEEAEALPGNAAVALTHLQRAARAVEELGIVKLEHEFQPDAS